MARLRAYGLSGNNNPRLQAYGLTGDGLTSPVVKPIGSYIIGPGETASMTAILESGEVADSYSWRQISGPTVTLSGTGANRSVSGPSVMPFSAPVIIGTKATLNSIESPEQTTSLSVLPQLSWFYDGTQWQGSKTVARVVNLSVPIAGISYGFNGTTWTAPGRDDLNGSINPQVTPEVAGSLAPGAADYGMPAGSVFVSSSAGSDSNTGTQALPWRTVQYAVNNSPSGTTIILRAGTYHESFSTPSTKILTIQSYPNEVVWFDGSSVYSSWTNNGNSTWTAPYTVTFSRFAHVGFPLTTDAYANYPDQVFIDGQPLSQIEDATTPATGQFSVNQTSNTITIGTNPVTHEVRIVDLSTCLTASGRTNFYGLGFRRYSPQGVEGLSSILYYGGTSAGTVIENCIFRESAMAGVNIAKAGFVVNKVTVEDCGYSGIMIGSADGLVVSNVLLRRLNRGLWSGTPATGAIKVTNTDNMIIKNCYVTDVPNANGLWLDVDCTRFSIVNNYVDGTNKGSGAMGSCITVEESEGGKLAGTQYMSIVAGNECIGSPSGLQHHASGYTKIYNNYFHDYTLLGLRLRQDRGENDENVKPASMVSWWTVGNEIVNNRFGPNNLQFLAYDDVPKQLLGFDMFTILAGNWFSVAPPGSMAQLGKIDGYRNSYNSLSALSTAPITVGDSSGKLGINYQGASSPDMASVASPLPSDVASALGIPAGQTIIGPPLPMPTAIN